MTTPPIPLTTGPSATDQRSDKASPRGRGNRAAGSQHPGGSNPATPPDPSRNPAQDAPHPPEIPIKLLLSIEELKCSFDRFRTICLTLGRIRFSPLPFLFSRKKKSAPPDDTDENSSGEFQVDPDLAHSDTLFRIVREIRGPHPQAWQESWATRFRLRPHLQLVRFIQQQGATASLGTLFSRLEIELEIDAMAYGATEDFWQTLSPRQARTRLQKTRKILRKAVWAQASTSRYLTLRAQTWDQAIRSGKQSVGTPSDLEEH